VSANVNLRLPGIIGVGPGRTGSTWLHRVLEGHVDLPCDVKETQFFNSFYDKGIDWYAHNFRHATGERPIVEIGPGYFFNPAAPDRIKTHIPDCKIITTMRDPVDRIYSAYKAQSHSGRAPRGTFDEAVTASPNLAGGSRYAAFLKSWFEHFGRENVLVTMYDELRAQPQSYLDSVTDFMGIERIALSARPDINDDVNSFGIAPKNRRLARRASKFRRWLRGHQAYGVVNLLRRAGVWDFAYGRGEAFGRLTPEQDARLRKLYLPEVEALEELMKIDLSAWKQPRGQRDAGTSPAPPLSKLTSR
jgi:hypothetical protein